ncbi:hypothetical protein GCM10022393_22460 [Aquimarina addita]|uniref:Uncharacterized protein n=1 Tax=Aquimarina addita TaxID=870485 RepID=A0ABP6UM03_9FLAO
MNKFYTFFFMIMVSLYVSGQNNKEYSKLINEAVNYYKKRNSNYLLIPTKKHL